MDGGIEQHDYATQKQTFLFFVMIRKYRQQNSDHFFGGKLSSNTLSLGFSLTPPVTIFHAQVLITHPFFQKVF